MPRAQAADENIVAGRVDSDRQPNRVERAALPEQLSVAVAGRGAFERYRVERHPALEVDSRKLRRRRYMNQRGAGVGSDEVALVSHIGCGIRGGASTKA